MCTDKRTTYAILYIAKYGGKYRICLWWICWVWRRTFLSCGGIALVVTQRCRQKHLVLSKRAWTKQAWRFIFIFIFIFIFYFWDPLCTGPLWGRLFQFFFESWCKHLTDYRWVPVNPNKQYQVKSSPLLDQNLKFTPCPKQNTGDGITRGCPCMWFGMSRERNATSV